MVHNSIRISSVVHWLQKAGSGTFWISQPNPLWNSKLISGSLAHACALSPSFNRYSYMPWGPVVVLSSWTMLLPSFAERAILFIVLVKIWLRITWFLLKTCWNTFHGFLRLSCHRISINAVFCYEDVVKIIFVLFSKISSYIMIICINSSFS